MSEFKKIAAIVIARLRQRGFSERTIANHEKLYQAMHNYFTKEGIHYTPELGALLLEENNDKVFEVKGTFIRAGCIAKLNDVYRNGDLIHAQLSPRKGYSSIVLSIPFEQAVADFLDYCQGFFTNTQLGNTRRRCGLFLKCMQSWGKTKLNDISYGDIRNYHQELSHLKQISKVVEESSLHQFLRYLAEQGQVSPGRYLYMYLLECDRMVGLKDLPGPEQRKIEELREDSLSFPAEEFRTAGIELVELHLKEGYAPAYIQGFEKTILYLYLFLDLHGLGYLPAVADIWLYSDAAKSVFCGSSWMAARRILNVFRNFASSGDADFGKVYRKGMTGLDNLPEWCRAPLEGFATQRLKQKLDESTVKNDIYSILRFCRFLIHSGLNSYTELTGKLILDFNLKDLHESPEGKNSCNGRVRRFLKYLYREGIVVDRRLYLALGVTAAPVETIIQTLTEDEIQSVKDYIGNAGTPLKIRDSAIILLGSDMGMRGSDIVSLKLSDIDWKDQCLRFRQNKTDVEAWLAMPTAVGNAIFHYLRDARPRAAKSDYVFVSMKTPYRRLTRNVCYGTLKRILPDRQVYGSGFHVTRKTFSTNRLQNGISPAKIADAIGHHGTRSLMPYLSLDEARISECALSIERLDISMKEGF